MRFFNFHLMPYAEVDLDAIERNSSAWVTFSNRHYDPDLGADLYHHFLDEMEYADQLGFDGVCVNEHHQIAYGLMPIPGVLAGALARSVKRADIAVLGRDPTGSRTRQSGFRRKAQPVPSSGRPDWATPTARPSRRSPR